MDNALSTLLFQKPMRHSCIKIRTAQTFVPVTPKNFDISPLTNVQHANVQCTPAEIVDHDVMNIVTLMQPVRQGRRGGFFHDTRHLQPGQFVRLERGIALRRFEFGRDGNHGGLYIVVAQMGAREGA
mmetsp:Transcript_24535/g.52035  ORF Transcript_24535/g.52035 Transcript_24535/m.52035 type:complete len:127 (-) Transcript_24535:1283-1663(-)